MFKKLLGLMLAITLLASTTAQAEILPEPVLGSSDGVITSVTASALTINPDEAQTTTISFTLSAPAAVSAYILYPNYGDAGFTDVNDTRIYFLGSDTTTVSLTPTTTSPYIWTGKVGNLPTGTSLVNGTYKVRVVATSGTPAVKNFAGVNVTIDDTYTNGIPSIRNLKADPSTFAADGNSDTEFTFNVTESANITAAVKKISAGGYEVVKSFSDYNGNWHTYSSSHSITWDGRDNAGNYVANGTYYFIVDASNTPGTNTGSDNEKIMLTITSDTVVSGTLENVKLDPSKNWDPTDGDLEIAYDLTKDARSVTVTAKKQGTN
ncbi:MAG: FlgD immunoglobulin-like domain containing protein, partial [Candidatus Gracilibacteria bacterium]